MLTPEQRTLRARIAAETRWGNTPIAERRRVSAPGLQAANDRFLRQVDEKFPGLSDKERHKLADNLRQAHMQRMAFASAKARAERAAVAVG